MRKVRCFGHPLFRPYREKLDYLGHFGPKRGHFGTPDLALFGPDLGRFWGVFGVFWGVSGPPGDPFFEETWETGVWGSRRSLEETWETAFLHYLQRGL